ncbi:MAG: hypothetical protein C0471_15980 [Erythrobacter sp.]|nr:hypothetical protein [Erythrobacter sp.]
MTQLRALFLHHRAMAMMLVAVALCMKALVPTGYMVGQGGKTLTIEFCSDGLTEVAAKQIVIPMKDGSDGSSGDHGQAKGDCAFSSLSMASLGGAQPDLLADALGFILATGFSPPALPILQSSFDLRPPLRGPPAVLLTI